MIGVQLHGRLGNQLFQYAFAYAASRKLDTSFYMDESIDHCILSEYFKLPSYSKTSNYIKRYFSKLKNTGQINIDPHKMPAQNISLLEKNKLYAGFFQSEEYFKECKEDIIQEFVVKKSLKNKFNDQYSDIFKKNNTIAVHIRRTDYKNIGEKLGGKDLVLPTEYYQKCLMLIPNVEKYVIIFISDDIKHVKASFNGKGNYIFSSNSAIIDLQILMNANVIIMANSSFSWWGSYLNKNPNKIVYGPRDWLGFKMNTEYPVGVMKPEFKWIQV